MKYLILTYLWLIPLWYWPNTELRAAQEFCYQICSLLIIVGGMFFENHKIKPSKLNMGIGALFVWFVAVYLRTQVGWFILINSLLGVLVYFTIIRTLKKDNIEFIFNILKWVLLYSVLALLCQYLGWDFRGSTERYQGGLIDCSVFGIKAMMGCYFALILPIVLSSWLWIALLVPVALSYSTGAYLAVGAGILFYLWYRRRKVFWISLVPLLIVSSLFIFKMDLPQGMYGSRLPMWKMVTQDVHGNVLGYGLDSFRNPKEGNCKYYKHSYDDVSVRVFNTKKGWIITPNVDEKFLWWLEYYKEHGLKKGRAPIDEWDHPHSEYVWVFYELGYPGLIGFIVIFYLVWDRFRKSKKNELIVCLGGGILAFLVTNITQFPLHVARVGHLVPILFALFYIATEEDEKTDNNFDFVVNKQHSNSRQRNKSLQANNTSRGG